MMAAVSTIAQNARISSGVDNTWKVLNVLHRSKTASLKNDLSSCGCTIKLKKSSYRYILCLQGCKSGGCFRSWVQARGGRYQNEPTQTSVPTWSRRWLHYAPRPPKGQLHYLSRSAHLQHRDRSAFINLCMASGGGSTLFSSLLCSDGRKQERLLSYRTVMQCCSITTWTEQ